MLVIDITSCDFRMFILVSLGVSFVFVFFCLVLWAFFVYCCVVRVWCVFLDVVCVVRLFTCYVVGVG